LMLFRLSLAHLHSQFLYAVSSYSHILQNGYRAWRVSIGTFEPLWNGHASATSKLHAGWLVSLKGSGSLATT